MIKAGTVLSAGYSESDARKYIAGYGFTREHVKLYRADDGLYIVEVRKDCQWPNTKPI